MLEVTNTTIKTGMGNWDNQHKDQWKKKNNKIIYEDTHLLILNK